MTINCKGTLIDLTSPKIMGILNLTPDSFYDGGRYQNEKSILEQTEKMLKEGATFIDLGGYSSRPKAASISEEDELVRLESTVVLLVKTFPDILLSIDTFRHQVAQKCLDAGATMINDISAGLLDDRMLDLIAAYQVPYIMMHMKGNPQNMQSQTDYKNLLTDIMFYFSERMARASTLKINDIIVDPGFGFSKTLEQNFELLQKLELFKTLDVPILAGLSRKSMIYKSLDTTAAHALNGTTALHMLALTKGANIIRVHDVAPAMECIKLYNQLPD